MSSPSKIIIPPGALEPIVDPSKKVALLAAVPYEGIQVDPFGDRSDPGFGYAAWEWWPLPAGASAPGGVFSAIAPDDFVSGGTLTTKELSQSSSTVGNSAATLSTSPGGGRAGRLTVDDSGTGKFTFSLDFEADFAISKVQLQIKHSQFLVDKNGTIVGVNKDNPADWPFVNPKLNGNDADSKKLNLNTARDTPGFSFGSWDASDGTDPAEGGTTTFYFVTCYVWEDLSILADTAFNVAFESANNTIGHAFAVDTVAIDVATS